MNLLVDTSVLFKVSSFERLAVAARGRAHRLLVPTLVWTERDAQVRRRLGRDYDPAVVDAFYATFEDVVDVLPWDRSEGAAAAARLALRFPTPDDWQEAKRDAARTALGVTDSPSKRRCGAQLDWYLAAAASPERPIVTAELRGAEWRGWADGSVLTVDAAIARMETA